MKKICSQKWLWLDDERTPPPGWTHVRTAWEAIWELTKGGVAAISLDWDLDQTSQIEDPGTGGDVIDWLYQQMLVRNWHFIPQIIQVHSANPRGVYYMSVRASEILRNLRRYFEYVSAKEAGKYGTPPGDPYFKFERPEWMEGVDFFLPEKMKEVEEAKAKKASTTTTSTTTSYGSSTSSSTKKSELTDEEYAEMWKRGWLG